MERSVHFISGLPRSGSTLLSAILRQNPRLHADMTSPVAGLMDAVLSRVSAGTELAPLVGTEQRKRLLRALFHAYHADLPDGVETVIDTNRAWTGRLPALVELFPEARVICCVRNVAWIMDSLERRVRDNPFEHTRLFNNPAERNSVYSRVDTLAQRDRLVGAAWSNLKEAMYSEHADRVLVVEYDYLVQRPKQVLDLVYQFLGEPAFEHDFDNVAYDAPAVDAQLGVDGLHSVRPHVAPVPRRTILPPDLFEKYAHESFWRDAPGSAARVIGPAEAGESAAGGG
jgi:sulfotransferase